MTLCCWRFFLYHKTISIFRENKKKKKKYHHVPISNLQNTHNLYCLTFYPFLFLYLLPGYVTRIYAFEGFDYIDLNAELVEIFEMCEKVIFNLITEYLANNFS